MIAAILLTFLLLPAPARATILPNSRSDAAAVKLTITQTGIYRVTGAELTRAGIEIEKVNPTNIRMFCTDTEIRFLSDASGPTFGSEDSIIFYGQSYSDIYTRENVYWIYTSNGQGSAMQTTDAAPDQQADMVMTSPLRLPQIRAMIFPMFWVDGVSKGTSSAFTIQDVKAAHTVRATFKSNRPVSGGGGSGGCFIRTTGG